MSWPMVSVKEIVRVAPGKYRGLMMEHGKGWKPCTFSVISKKELVQKSEGKIVGLYQKIRCDDEQWFLRDFDDMIRQAQTAEVSVAQIQPSDIQAQRNPEATQTASLSEHFVAKKSSITIYNMSICPAAITPGSKFDLQFEYMINDPSLSNDLVLAQFSYCILENEKIIARSKPTVIECEGGQKIEEIIHLVGSTHKGVYTIQITLQYKGEVIEKRGELVICDKPQVMVQEPPRDVVTQQQIPSMNVMPDPGTLGKYRSNVGSIYYFRVTGQDSGNIYGTDVYTDDSQLATAAVHAGVLARGQQGVVKVTILPGQPRYQGSFRNGINSHSWGMWRSSYTVTEAKMF